MMHCLNCFVAAIKSDIKFVGGLPKYNKLYQNLKLFD